MNSSAREEDEQRRAARKLEKQKSDEEYQVKLLEKQRKYVERHQKWVIRRLITREPYWPLIFCVMFAIIGVVKKYVK